MYSSLVIKSVCDGDMCKRLGDIAYSTNPRKYITIDQMQRIYNLNMVNYNR